MGTTQPHPVLFKPLLGIDLQLTLTYLLGDHARGSLATWQYVERDI